MADLEGLKKVLRSLVVSTPTTMDAASLLRDYRRMLGEALPSARYGYRDPVLFLRERCSDCFLFQGPQSNPILTLIVPDAIKHIDQYVQSQKMPSKQIRGKRRSVPESVIRHPQNNLVATTFRPAPKPAELNNNRISSYSGPVHSTLVTTKTHPTYTEARKPEPEPPRQTIRPVSPKPISNINSAPLRPVPKPVHSENIDNLSAKMETLSNGNHKEEETSPHARQRLQRFLEKRTPAYQSQLISHGSAESLKIPDNDSGRQTSSSASGRSAAALATLQEELAELVARRPGGVWCSQLLRIYEEEYGRELNFSRFGFPSVSACACAVEALTATRARSGDWLLTVSAPPSASAPAVRPRRPSQGPPKGLQLESDDALPGIDYDPDVFPADCLNFMESIPSGSVADVSPGDMLAVVVGELYSPSHMWLLRLGPDYDTMEEYMDEMTEYYSKGPGKDRVLAAGARRPGQYCSSVFEGDWHRSLVVQVLDEDTVKVLHVDYGTVDTVAASALRPLRRQWAALPAMAVRARLAGLRPAAASRRWPRAAAQHCLHLVRERRLVGNVVAVDHEESIVELFLIDTSTDEDVNISSELIRAGHADRRPRPALGACESYLLPLFRVLEAGDTPNYAEIHALLRDGIALEFVDSYRRHVSALLPSDDSDPTDDDPDPDATRPPADGDDTSELGDSASPSPPPPPPAAANRVPLRVLLSPAGADSPPAPAPASVGTSTSPPPESPRSTSPEAASPEPASPEPASTPVFVFSAPRKSPAPVEAAVPSAGAAKESSPARSVGAPRTELAARSPHPTSFYALPFYPYTQVSAGYPQPTYSVPQQTYPVPQQTAYSVPQQPIHTVPQSPIYSVPQQPTHTVPQSPIYSMPQPPTHTVPQSPIYSMPQPPTHTVPQSPIYSMPQPPTHTVPQSPIYSMPQPPRFAPAPYAYPQYRPAPPHYAAFPRPAPGASLYGPGPGPRSTPATFGAGAGPEVSVRLSATECEVFERLSRTDPGMAHRYMIDALRRARAQAGAGAGAGAGAAAGAAPGGSALNPEAAEFRAPAAAGVRPPPGFENSFK